MKTIYYYAVSNGNGRVIATDLTKTYEVADLGSDGENRAKRLKDAFRDAKDLYTITDYLMDFPLHVYDFDIREYDDLYKLATVG